MLGAFIQLDDFGFPSLSTDGTRGFCGNLLVLLDDFGSPIFYHSKKTHEFSLVLLDDLSPPTLSINELNLINCFD
jgi:hypothetical protein